MFCHGLQLPAAPQKEPNFGCPVGKDQDTCPGDRLLDDIHNYMVRSAQHVALHVSNMCKPSCQGNQY